jgi:predicted XRE-type DNA-binding protein
MNDKEFMDKIRELVETIKFYETTETLGQNEIKSLLKHYRSELENLLFGNI